MDGQAEQPKEKNLKVNFIFSFISQVLVLIIPFITTPYVSRVLHEEGNGQISYAFSVVTVFLLFANLGFENYGQREIAKVRDNLAEKSKVFWELFLARSITTALTSAVFIAMYFTIGFHKSNTLVLIYAIELFGNFLDINFLFKGEEKFKLIAVRTILMRLAGMVCIFLFVRNETHTWVYALCIAVSFVGSNLLLWPSAFRSVAKTRTSWKGIFRHFLPTLAVFVPALGVTVFSTVDKLEIGWFAQNSDYENGCYEQAYKIIGIALLLVTSIAPVMSPRSSYDFKNDNMEGFHRHKRQSFGYVWMMGIPLLLGFVIVGGRFSAIYLGEGYAVVPLLMQIMSVRFLVSGFGEMLSSVVFLPIGKEKTLAITTSITAVINIALNIPFVILWGALGASIATAITEALGMLILLIVALKRRILSLSDLFSGVWQYLVAAGFMLIVVVPLHLFLPHNIISFIAIAGLGGCEYFVILAALKNPFVEKGLAAIQHKLFRKKDRPIIK